MQEYSVATHRIGVCTVVRNTNGHYLYVPRFENPEVGCSAGGGMEFAVEEGLYKDITTACTAKRELFEETGIDGKVFVFLGVVYEDGKDGVSYATHVYLLEDPIDPDFPLVPEKGIQPIWVTEEEFVRRAAFPSSEVMLRWARRFDRIA